MLSQYGGFLFLLVKTDYLHQNDGFDDKKRLSKWQPRLSLGNSR